MGSTPGYKLIWDYIEGTKLFPEDIKSGINRTCESYLSESRDYYLLSAIIHGYYIDF